MLTLVDGTERDARDLAERWLRSRGSADGYWFQRPWAGGRLVEAHDGGTGASYLMPLADAIESQADATDEPEGPAKGGLLKTAGETLSLELTPSGLRTLSMSRERFDSSLAIKPTAGVMRHYRPNPFVPVALLAAGLTLISGLALVLALSARPVPEPITVHPTSSNGLWETWSERIEPLADDPSEVTVRFDGESWTWE
ncbi:hypothetical protein TK90_2864 (plasmid) [Thioalkalivibrio sp. K90mix]|nr:hypothetical protein TK90_2864 [Thioalkalivibrio sp. K90mix]